MNLTATVFAWLVSYSEWSITWRWNSNMISSAPARRILLKEFVDEGIPGPEHFTVEQFPFCIEESKEKLGDGSILVELRAVSADPYIRLGIKSGSAGLGHTTPNNPIIGFVVGQVLSSRNSAWQDGDLFGAQLPFVTYQTISSQELLEGTFWKLSGLLTESNLTYGLGVMGMPGATAYGGITGILQPKESETIFISAASGAVGGLVGQIAKHVYGCDVIGSCGGKEKCDLITRDYGFDYAIDYKSFSSKDEYVNELVKAAPEGIDMYWENVGGAQFEAALEVLRPGGRVALCGWISDYNSRICKGTVIHPAAMLFKQQKMEGFLCFPWLRGEKGNFLQDMARWLREGKFQIHETVFHGLETWPLAFQTLFTGAKVGKVVVRV